MSTRSNLYLLFIGLGLFLTNIILFSLSNNWILKNNLFEFFSSHQSDIKEDYQLILSTQDNRKLRSWELFSNSEKLNKAKFKAKLCNSSKCSPIKVRAKGDMALHWETKRKSYRFKFTDDLLLNGDVIDFTLADDRYYEIEFLAKALAEDLSLIQLPFAFKVLSVNNSHKTFYFQEHRYRKLNMEKYLKEYTHIVKMKNIWLPHLKQANIGTFYYGFRENKYEYNSWRNYPQLYSIEPKRNTNDVIFRFDKALTSIRTRSEEINNYFHLENSAKWFAILSIFGSYHGTLGDNLSFLYDKADRKFTPIVNDVLIRPIKSSFSLWLERISQSNDFLKELFTNNSFVSHYKKNLRRLIESDIIKKRKYILNEYKHLFYLNNVSRFLIDKGINNREKSLKNNISKIKEYLE